VNRRKFLALLLTTLAARSAPALGAMESRKTDYVADVAILYRMFSLHLRGTVDEVVDRAAGRYEVTISGEGNQIANRAEYHGLLRDGRWMPARSASWLQVAGRESRRAITYDHEARRATYRYRGETFLLRRVREADAVVSLPAAPVDDAVSAALNYADGRWRPDTDGRFRTTVIRRRRPADEGTDDVTKVHGAELMPIALKIGADPESGKSTALFDLSGFSSWAREERPARIVFGADRRPELIEASLILGTSFDVRVGSR
jgi:hypothetical protein